MTTKLLFLCFVAVLAFMPSVSAAPCCGTRCQFWSSTCSDEVCEELCNGAGCNGGEEVECNTGTVLCKCGPNA